MNSSHSTKPLPLLTTSSTSSSSINISNSNIAGKCNLKCAYHFKYTDHENSSLTATNYGVLVRIAYENQGSSGSPVLYNKQKYTVSHIELVCPSVHLFNGATMAGELLIKHEPVQGGNPLTVCVPLTSSSESTPGTPLLTTIIQTVATNAPAEGDSTVLQLSSFSLNTLVPKKPFYAYSDNKTDWIVFGDLTAIPLSAQVLSTLQQILQPFSLATPGTALFYNSEGPDTGLAIGDGIYISCKPTGSSEETTAVTYDTSSSSSSVDFTNVWKSPYLKWILVSIAGCLLLLALFYGVGAGFDYLGTSAKPTIRFPIPIPTFT